MEGLARAKSSNVKKATVAIPVHNGGSFLAYAITSALNQDYENLEVLVIDNASTDNTSDVVLQFPTVKYFRFDDFASMPTNFNRAIDLADGEYVRILCADDTLRTDCLRLSIAALDSNESLVMCASSETIRRRGATDSYQRSPALLGLVSGSKARRHLLREGNIIGGPSGVTVLGAIYKFVRFNESLPCSFDLDAWVRILRLGNLVVLPDALYESTLHTEQATNICRRGGFQKDWAAILRSSRRSAREPGVFLYSFLRIKNTLSRIRRCAT